MRRLFTFIVKQRDLVLVIYALLIAVSAAMFPRVPINASLTDYLPSDAPSTRALKVMEAEFGGDVPNAQLMVEDIPLREAEELASRLKKIPGIKKVSFAPGADFLAGRLELLPESMLSGSYKDGNALYTLTIDEDSSVSVIEQAKTLTDHKASAAGNFVDSKTAMETSKPEILKTIAVVVVFGIIVLMFTLDSWVTPFILVFCLMAAVLINGGSNLIFGSISYVTNTAASVLQMGVSVDYSIFLLHRFRECRREGLASEEAMVNAMLRSGRSITSSALTTVIGFVALMFMRYGIGMDMGRVLAKGIFISLICTFTLLPALILRMEPLIERTSRRALIGGARPAAEIMRRISVPAAVLFVLLVIPSAYFQSKNTYYYGTSHIYKDAHPVMLERAAVNEAFGTENTLVLLFPSGRPAAEHHLAKELSAIPELTSQLSASSLLGSPAAMQLLPEEYAGQLATDSVSRIVLTLDLDAESPRTFEVIEAINEAAEKYYPGEYALAGNSASTYDLKAVITADKTKVDLIAVGAVFAVLLLTFRSLSAAFLLALTIEGSIWICMTASYVAGQPLFYIGSLIVGAILLGATVDYAILMTSRYKEYRALFTKKESAFAAVEHAGVSVATSALILAVAGFLLSVFCTNQVVAQLGHLLARGTLTAAFTVLFILPAFLQLFDQTL